MLKSISMSICSLGVTALFSVGCAKSTPPPETAYHTPDQEQVASADTKLDENPCAGATVFFDTESTELDMAAEKRLDELALCLANKNVHEIVVTGRADPQGASRNNDALSMKRAEKLVAALEQRGVSTSLLVIRAYGESDASQLRVMWPYERRGEVRVTASEDADEPSEQ